MSGNKPVGTELPYAFYGAATVSTPTVSPGSDMIITYPPIVVPPKFFGNTGDWSSSAKLKLGGLMTATATVPTWQFILYASPLTTTAPAFATTGINMCSCAAFTPTAGANNWWDIELELGLRTLARGAASTISVSGWWRGALLNAAGLIQIPAAGAYTPPATYDTTQPYVLWPALVLGAATALNTVTTQYAKLYGEN